MEASAVDVAPCCSDSIGAGQQIRTHGGYWLTKTYKNLISEGGKVLKRSTHLLRFVSLFFIATPYSLCMILGGLVASVT
ncbi:hypothetical protein Peur_072305 [Populus x canadensis]